MVAQKKSEQEVPEGGDADGITRRAAAGGGHRHWQYRALGCGPVRADGAPNVRRFGTTTDELHALANWLVAQHVESVATWRAPRSTGSRSTSCSNPVGWRSCSSTPASSTTCRDGRPMSAIANGCSCSIAAGCYGTPSGPPRRSSGSARCSARWPSSSRSARAACSGCKRPSTSIRSKCSGGRGPHGHHGDGDRPGHRGRRARSHHPWRPIAIGAAASPSPRSRATSPAPGARNTSSRLRRRCASTTRSATRSPPSRRGYSRSSPRSRRPSVAPTPSPPIRTPPRRKASAAGVSSRSARRSGASRESTSLVSTASASGSREVVVTEVGPHLAAFPSEDAFVSWLRLCPRTPDLRRQAPQETSQRPRRQPDRGGHCGWPHHRATVQDGSRGIVSPHRAPQKGAAVAVFATARHLAKLIYRMLRFGQDYVDVGEHAYERRFQLRRLVSLTEAARSLGFTLVERTPERAPG